MAYPWLCNKHFDKHPFGGSSSSKRKNHKEAFREQKEQEFAIKIGGQHQLIDRIKFLIDAKRSIDGRAGLPLLLHSILQLHAYSDDDASDDLQWICYNFCDCGSDFRLHCFWI